MAILYGNPDCRMQIFDEHPIDTIDEIPEYKDLGIESFRMVLTDENAEESRKLREQFKKELSADNRLV